MKVSGTLQVIAVVVLLASCAPGPGSVTSASQTPTHVERLSMAAASRAYSSLEERYLDDADNQRANFDLLAEEGRIRGWALRCGYLLEDDQEFERGLTRKNWPTSVQPDIDRLVRALKSEQGDLEDCVESDRPIGRSQHVPRLAKAVHDKLGLG